MVIDKGRVRFAPLEVPVMVTVAFVGGRTVGLVLPAPQPLAYRKLKSNTARTGGIRRFRRRPCANIRSTRIKTIPNVSRSGEIKRAASHGGWLSGSTCGSVIALEVLLIVTVNAYEDDPLGGTNGGDTTQVDGAGAPLQVSTTLPLNPLTGVTCRLYVAVWPAVITDTVEQFPSGGQLEPLASASEKSGAAATPLPFKLMIWGDANALSVITIDAIRFPRTLGVNVMLNVQLPPAAMLAPQVFVCEKSPAWAPVKLMLAILKAAAPPLVNVTVRAVLVKPVPWFPKLTRLGAILAAGVGPAPTCRRIETCPPATAKSGAPSPLKSPIATVSANPFAPKLSAG